MGNRALIANKERTIEIYLHWYGGRESVKAFLDYCKARGFRWNGDQTYGWARLCQVIGNFFGGGLSLGIGPYGEYGVCDNGRYIIDDWKIIGRESAGNDEHIDLDYYEKVLREVNRTQPENDRLTDDVIDNIVSETRMEQEGE